MKLLQEIDRNTTGYSAEGYESLMDWYRKTSANHYRIEHSCLQESAGDKYFSCKIELSHLTLIRKEFPKINEDVYQLDIFCNFCSGNTFVAKPYQNQPLKCVLKEGVVRMEQPWSLFYHCKHYRQLTLFIEFQLNSSQNDKIRLGYVQISPYIQSPDKSVVNLQMGWPLDKKEPKDVGTLVYRLESSSKLYGALKTLIPHLTIVDVNNKIPCCKKLLTKKAIEVENLTQIQIDEVVINKLKIDHTIQKMKEIHASRLGVTTERIKMSEPIVAIQIGFHNTWRFVGDEIVKNFQKNKENFQILHTIKVRVSNTKSTCLLATVTMSYEIHLSTENANKSNKNTLNICWYMFPLELWKETSYISIQSLNKPIGNIELFEQSQALTLTCRITNQDFRNFKPPKINSEEVSILRIFEPQVRRTSQWKTFNPLDRQNTMDEYLKENNAIVKEQKKIEKMLAKKLYRDKQVPKGRNRYEKIDVKTDALKIEQVINKSIECTARIESFTAYTFDDSEGIKSSYFVPRIISIKIFYLNQVVMLKQLVLDGQIVYGVPVYLVKLSFQKGQSIETQQKFKISLDVDEKSYERILKHNLFMVVYDQQSHLPYAETSINLASFIDSQRLRLELTNEQQVRGSISLDINTVISKIKKNTTVSEHGIPTTLIANQLSDRMRIESRINNFKAMKGNSRTEPYLKETELELIKKYKQEKIKIVARATAEKAQFQHTQIIHVQSCVPSFIVWEYTNQQGSLNNDYRLVINDSDASILSVEQLHLVRNKAEFEEICSIINTENVNFIEANYKNQFHLKNNHSVKIILKFLTYRAPSTTKIIEPHPINITLERNTIPCAKRAIYIEPSLPDIDNLFTFYKVAQDIVELQLTQQFSKQFSSNYLLSVASGTVCRWIGTRYVVSANCQGPSHRQLYLVAYKDKTRVRVLSISKIILNACQGITKSIKLGQSFSYFLKLSSQKLRVARLQTSHPNIIQFESPIVSVSSRQSSHGITVFPKQPGRTDIKVTVIDVDSNELIKVFVVDLSVIEDAISESLTHHIKPLTTLRQKLRFTNNIGRPCQFHVVSAFPLLEVTSQPFYLQEQQNHWIHYEVRQQQMDSHLKTYLFFYSDSNILVDCRQIIVMKKESS